MTFLRPKLADSPWHDQRSAGAVRQVAEAQGRASERAAQFYVSRAVGVSGEQTNFSWQSASVSNVGSVRKVNEDAYLDSPELGLWVVADGMGGHEAGDVASKMVVESFHGLQAPVDLQSFIDDLLLRLQNVNGDLVDYAERHAKNVVGSTVAILVGFGDQCTCLWAGDSRIYLLRDGRLRQVTRDHSQVEELISLGLLDREEAESHPAGNVITRAVGAADSLAVDMVSHELRHGDVYLICSDGLNKVVSDREIGEILRHGSCHTAVQSLIDGALRLGAKDNVTAVVVQVSAGTDSSENTSDTLPL